MSGIFKGIKKVFKKVTKFIKRYWKQIIIAAAIVFTAGAAAGLWGAAAAGGAAAGGAAAGAAAGAAGATAAGAGTVFGAAGGAAALGAGTATALGATSMGALGMGGLAAGGALGAGVGGAFAGLAAAGGAAAATGAAAGGALGSSGGAAAGSGGAAASGGGAASGAGGAITNLQTVTVTAPAQAGGVSLADTVGASAVGSGGTAPFSGAAAEVAPQAATQVAPQVAKTGVKGLVSKVTGGVKNMWGGLSSFEKVQLLATGVNMLAGATAPKSKEGEFPLANQFYGRDKENKGPGMAFDYDKVANKFVPADTRFVAKPEAPGPTSQQGVTKTSVPDSFIEAPPKDRGKMASFVPDNNEELQKRLEFVQKGYESGDYSGSTV